ncbi:UNVERIFIED_ORG: nicotinate-nicotinamide nucleotide adenylyltransferase [Clostridium botulinum]|uniref:Probable nicotinate-nucleotide adenylyltransferase n=1 Tax=Clostridium botulinum TaxID=1491 RepID=A0A6B4JNA3_CLOBO|nr:nicotinate-nucleotide adenylyltransferase [Clostridium botulinum]EES50393.1 nicotinate-nucleotide adenylyltransferase [Clostridium botulinum E1 str. 'BoNT E Beluga']KIL08826.1 nicotinate-nucleotide adenylyltransferase [Clostridium botulinum]MBN1070061.1 nicotinate-nucleotide adenylyltransferase [Clostridium botulinum]MBY6762130.1 nicotinate-nucleotide adenylyltransferase [Clostridium botulinum]MBY6920557.1 nicotinate-nucleotide adenylyltransferase [Clostridium botulinum]
MKRYGIIGGTFDPIHYGHLYIAYEAKKQLRLDKIIFMPAGNPPHKEGKKITSAKLRYEMVKSSIKDFSGFSISKYEIEKKGFSYTYETLEHFKNNDVELFFITGADCLMDIEKWESSDKILSLSNLVVFSRGGFSNKELIKQKEYIEKKYHVSIILLTLKRLEISSTDIRERIKNKERVDFFVPQPIIKLIEENNLYKEE